LVKDIILLFAAQVCSHLKTNSEGAMCSVTVRIRAAEFSSTMIAIGEWLDANRHEPTRYKYDHHEDAVLVTVDFPAEVAAEAFAVRFDGVHHLSSRHISPDTPRLLPT
jgi:hypothetical protein